MKNKMATLSEHIPVLAAILSDISAGCNMNFIYVLLASTCRQRNNELFKRNKITVCLQTDSLPVLGHVTKAARISFFDPKKMRALSQERVVQLRIIPENQDLSKNAP